MAKIKKVSIAIIMCLSVIAIMVMSVGAYETSSMSEDLFPTYIPQAEARINRGTEYSYTQTPTAWGKPIQYWGNTELYRGGNEGNSVKILVGNSIENPGIGQYTFIENGYIYYNFISANAFEFKIDTGYLLDSLKPYYPNYYEHLMYDTGLYIGVTTGYFDYVNSSGFGYSRIVPDEDFEYFVEADYVTIENGEISTKANYIRGNLIDNNTDCQPLYIVGDGDAVTTISGEIQKPDPYGYVQIQIRIATHSNHFDGANRPLIYFDNELTTVTQQTNRFVNYMLENGISSGYDSGFDDGVNVGNEQGYYRGYENGLLDGYENGFEDGEVEGQKGVSLFKSFLNSIQAILDFPIIPLPDGNAVTLGLLLGVIVGAMIFIWILKLIAGG